MQRKIFLNLPLKDLKKSQTFFAALGFTFNPKFTDENAACLVIGENILAMLLTEKFFKTFTKGKEICDTSTHLECLTAIDVGSRGAVDEMLGKAVAAGGSEFRPPEDHGWMYSRSFTDPDGHVWEVAYMDESRMPTS